MFALRDYQSALIQDTRAALSRNRAVLLQLPTGGGKTALGAYMTSGATERGRRTWFLVHRDFLLAQTVAAFRQVGISTGIIAAGHAPNPFADVQVVSIPTLARRYHRMQPPDFAIVDECHHAPSRTWRNILQWMTCPVVGLTATPSRLDGRGLSEFFGEIVCGPSVAELISAGYLSDYRAYAPSRPDLSAVHTRAGDYATDELASIMDDGQIIGDIVGWYKRLAAGKRAIYFAVSVRHSQHIAVAFNAAGIPARHLDASSTTEERLGAAREFASSRILVLTNVDLFGEGYDLASQAGTEVTVEAVGLARPTQSLVLHLQQVGRSLRPKPNGERAIILDHAGNLARHGLPDREREWSLEGIPKKKKGDSGPAIRMCPACFAVHRPAAACPYCGHVYIVEPRTPEEVAGELAEVDRERARIAERHSKRREEHACRTLDTLCALGQSRGYRHPRAWAENLMRARAGKMVRKREMV